MVGVVVIVIVVVGVVAIVPLGLAESTCVRGLVGVGVCVVTAAVRMRL